MARSGCRMRQKKGKELGVGQKDGQGLPPKKISADKIAEKELESLLEEDSKRQRKQMDADGVFVSEALLAAAMQTLEAWEEGRLAQEERQDGQKMPPVQPVAGKKGAALARLFKSRGRQLGTLAAALLAAVLLFGGGIGLLPASHKKGESGADRAPMDAASPLEQFGNEGNSPNGETGLMGPYGAQADGTQVNNAQHGMPMNEPQADGMQTDGTQMEADGNAASAPEAPLPLTEREYVASVSIYGTAENEEATETLISIETASYASAAERGGRVLLLQETGQQPLLTAAGELPSLTAEGGIEPQLFYEGECSALMLKEKDGEILEILFDYPQNFVYSCGREGKLFYLLVTRRMPSGGYGHLLLLLDFAKGTAEAKPLPHETDGFLTWISWQDGSLSYQ